MKHPPIDPNRFSYYYYSIAILDQVLCDDNEIKFSNFVRLKKISNITDPLGMFILGEDATQNSKNLANGKLDICDDRIKQATLPPFGEGIMDMGTYNFTHYRSLVYSDCVIESSFIENNPAIWNNNKEQVLQQIGRVLTSIRLLNSAPIRCLGPIECFAHPALHTSLEFPICGENHPYKEQLSGKIQANSFILIDTNNAKTVVAFFCALADPPSWLETALERLNISYSRNTIRDQLIDTIIGLEALYLHNLNAELRFRLATRAAIHQESDPDARWDTYSKLLFLYDARSKIVHGGNTELDFLLKKEKSPYETKDQLISSAREILRKGCHTVLLKRVQFECWDNDFHTNLDKSIFYNPNK